MGDRPDQLVPRHAARERLRFVRNLNPVGRSVTLLELPERGLTTGAAVSPSDVHALGYAMASAIAREQGDRAIGELDARPEPDPVGPPGERLALPA